jgi:methionyl-tRNA formyltransferase
MTIIFFGTSEFAVSALENLIASRHKVLLVVTQPQKKKGRGLKALPSPVELCAKDHSLDTANFDDINSEKAVKFLKGQKADLFVVVSFGQILSKEVLDIPKLYPINIHASLLPKYRGAAPIQRAVINGEKITGVTIMRITEPLDSGDIIMQKECEIKETDTTLSLSERLSALGAGLLIEALDGVDSGKVKFIPQDESKTTYASKLKKEDGLIDWNKDAVSIKNLVRGCYSWPGAYTYFNKKLLKIIEAEAVADQKNEKPGSVLEANEKGILVACKPGALLIKRLQLEGKNPLSAAEFLRGNPISPGALL